MNFFISKKCLAAPMLSAVCVFAGFAAHAQQGMLEIHGVITSPGCKVNFQSVAQLNQQGFINGQACGLTKDTRNHLSQLNIARIREEAMFNTQGVALNKKLVTFTYH
jgi:type 1 fimbria pilin